ncbi:Methyl-accepting chemotaxis protein [Herbaspirillum rubrisubalbicans M1]|uniref:chemotaxis protein CheW n=1 Tax=Herbaspirillum rubrisubalbicans TaxID=80842 RepID=UPI00073AC9AD|nr:chemotaxis protein CheW [Herbaspirillum rubrisubalbicans]ALU90798.1 Methyl-accepting chemotaxis protein [Herbaspirillum rubrisubalbicans M1]
MNKNKQSQHFLRHMPAIVDCERALRELSGAWRLIESTTKMVCPAEAKSILPTIKITREGFNQLEKRLIANLVEQNISKVVQEFDFKARVIIDIVVRNLFERTADVGFLAMDDAIRSFILEGPEADSREIVERLQAYRQKYTVYDEIFILDTEGRVLAHLDQDNAVECSYDPLVARTLAAAGYVETFAVSDLRGGQRALIYSHKIVDPADGQPIGVLCLCFPVAVEMNDIFSGLRKPHDRSVMLMLDGEGRVIASSDSQHVPVGCIVPLALEDSYQIVSHAGREYLARTCAARNYQGYSGPGWFGHVMVACDLAFRQPNQDMLAQYDPQLLAGVMSHAKSFCPPLHDVTTMADAINHSLRRVVWNGKIMASGEAGDLLRLKAILQEISQTGDETNEVFRKSILDLYATALSANLQDGQYISRLMVDIMDRNLYERANDCRWWSLTPRLRQIMAKEVRSAAELAEMTAILSAINALYTVYARLVVFDAQGRIVATSSPLADGSELIGTYVEPQLLRDTLHLTDASQYCVSPFAPTPLYDGAATYLYCAALFHPERAQAMGGIAVVFDATPEFANMLAGALPEHPGAFAAYTDRHGQVISSTHADYPPGSVLPLGSKASAGANGSSTADIRIHEGSYMVVGHTTSFGYREYKNDGQYVNDVIASVFVPIGQQSDAEPALESSSVEATPCTGPKREFASIRLDGATFALPAAQVVESIEAERMLSTSTFKPVLAGALDYQDGSGAASVFVPVVDMRQLLLGSSTAQHQGKEIIIVRHAGRTVGLLVDSLHDVLEFGEIHIDAAFRIPGSEHNYICNLIRTADAGSTIQVIDVERIVTLFFAPRKKELSTMS